MMGRELGFKFFVVFDDAVVNEEDFASAVGVGVLFARFAVRGPAGVADADAVCALFGCDFSFKTGDFTFGFE